MEKGSLELIEETVDQTPFRGNSEKIIDFSKETFLLGALGLTFASFAVGFVLLFGVAAYKDSLFNEVVFVVAVSCAIACLLAMMLNNLLVKDLSHISLYTLSVFLTGLNFFISIYVDQLIFFSAFLSGVGLTCLCFSWCDYLCHQTHSTVNVVLILVFSAIGIVFIVSCEVDATLLLLFSFVFTVASVAVGFTVKKIWGLTVDQNHRSFADSVDGYKSSANHFPKVFADGLVLSFFFVSFVLRFPWGGVALSVVIGIIVITSSLFVGLARASKWIGLEGAVDKAFLCFFAPCALLLVVGKTLLVVVFSGFALWVAVGCTLIFIAAMCDNVRVFKISSYWNFGCEGSFYFLGAAVGGFISFVAFSFFDGAYLIEAVALLLVVLIILHVKIIGGTGYPELDDVEDESRNAMEQMANTLRVEDEDWSGKTAFVAKKYQLSPRQTEVFHLLAMGCGARAISEKLVISPATAKTHIYNIYRKIGVHSQYELFYLIEKANGSTRSSEFEF